MVIKRIALLAAAAMLAVVDCHPCRAEDKTPDWLRAAAQEKLPEYPRQNEAVAIVLLDEEQVTVQDNGQILIRTRQAYKILHPEARDSAYSRAVVTISNKRKLTYFRAWTIMPNGHEIEVREKRPRKPECHRRRCSAITVGK